MSAISNARWASISQAAKTLCQLLGVTVLSRLLVPADYGLMAMALVVTNLAMLIRDMGTAAALIHTSKLTDATVSTVFWFNIGIGLSLALLLLLGAPLIAMSMRAPQLMQVLCALAIVFPIGSVGAVHQALMERESRFKQLAFVEISAAIAGLIVAISTALMGWGVYSLVMQSITMAALSAVQLWGRSNWRPHWLWSSAELAGLWAFSGNLSAFNFINYFSRNVDSMIIGRFLGPGLLGFYSLAYRVMLFPLQTMTMVASRALFPVLSRKQDNLPEMAALYLKSVAVIAYITAPLMVGLFVLREPFVAAVFGPKWRLTADVIAWLAPVGFIQSINSTTGVVFMARGRTDLMLRMGILGAMLMVSAFFIGVRWGVVGVAASYFVANVINVVPSLYFALRQLCLPLHAVVGVVLKPITIAVLMGCSVFALQYLLAFYQVQLLLSLLCLIGTGVIVYLLGSLLVARDRLSALLELAIKR